MPGIVMVRGGGDLASGVVLRLHRAGLRVLVTELPQPMVVRRLVAFANAVYSGEAVVEGVVARLADSPAQALSLLRAHTIPVLVDSQAECLAYFSPSVLVDGRMTKQPGEGRLEAAALVIGLGPGFIAGQNCHAVVETNRGHRLGRVIWDGSPEADTGIPDRVIDRASERVLRAPADGILEAHAEICDAIEAGQLVASVAGKPVYAPFRGVLRGMVFPGVQVREGVKIGDIDPRNDPSYCTLVSDKSLAVGGGVLEAILTRPEVRATLWV